MNESAAEDIGRRLMEAAEVFAEHNPYPQESQESYSVWWNRVPEAASQFGQAVEAVRRANPSQLSFDDTARTLTYGTHPSLADLAIAQFPADKEQLGRALKQRVLQLANAQLSRRLQLIIHNIAVDGPVPRFFGVDLIAPTQKEMQALYDDQLIGHDIQTNAVGLATIDAPGDQHTAFEWGIRHVQRFLNLIQGCGADIVLGGRFHPPHILNRNPIVERTPIRELTPFGPRTTLLIGYGATQVHFARVVADFLGRLTPEQINRLVRATTAVPSPILGAVVASMETLGEACKPHEDPARLLLISSALEMLVGARWSGDISYRGQNAAVAERATFLVGGSSTADRLQFDKRVRELYGKGSGVRHGDRPEVSHDEVVELASIARQVAAALLDRADSIRTRDDLDRWVQQMRYST